MSWNCGRSQTENNNRSRCIQPLPVAFHNSHGGGYGFISAVNMPFTKLDSGITKSSIWSENLHVRVVWISFLAEKDENGFVAASRSGMIRICNVTPEQFDEAIKILESPDAESRTPDFDGRRIEKIEGGWVVLNHEKYRLPENEKKKNRNEYMKEYMKKRRDVNINKVNTELTPVNAGLTSVSVSASESESVSESEDSNPPNNNEPEIPEPKTWREDYETYVKDCEAGFDALYADWAWIREQRVFYPGVAIQRSLDKMFQQFWGTKAGWKHKKSKKSKELNWKLTIENGLGMKGNKCYWGKDECDTEAATLRAKGLL